MRACCTVFQELPGAAGPSPGLGPRTIFSKAVVIHIINVSTVACPLVAEENSPLQDLVFGSAPWSCQISAWQPRCQVILCSSCKSLLICFDRVRDFVFFFCYFLAASAAKNCEKIAVIQSAASAAFAQGGCASSRLDHGLKFYVIPGGCASSRLINGFSDCEQSVAKLRYPENQTRS